MPRPSARIVWGLTVKSMAQWVYQPEAPKFGLEEEAARFVLHQQSETETFVCFLPFRNGKG